MTNDRLVTILFVVGLLGFVVGATTMGMLYTTLVMVLYVGLSVYCWAWLQAWAYTKLLEQYARQRENLYEYSRSENDREVYRRAEEHRQLLKESKNELQVEVKEIYYRDWDHPNETWDSFEFRREAEIARDRAKRHAWLNSQGRDFYKAAILEQDGIQY